MTALVVLTLPLASAPAAADPSAELTERLKSASQELEVVVEQYNALRLDVRHSQAEASRLRARIGPLEEAAATRSAEVGLVVAAAYRSGRAANAMGLIAAGSPAELGNRLAMLEALGRQRTRAVEALAVANEDVAVAQEALATVTAREKMQGAQLLAKKRHIEAEIDRLTVMRASLSLDDPMPAAMPLPSLPPGAARTAVRFAYAQLGKPYRWAAAGPDSYDCSGLVAAAWHAAGIALPHNARAQYGSVAHVRRDQLEPGDLVFYYGDIHHVGLYVGGGRIIHAPQEGERIRFDNVDYQPIHGYGRPG